MLKSTISRPSSGMDTVRNELFYDFSSMGSEDLAFLVFDRESGKATSAAQIPRSVYEELAETMASTPELRAELEALFPGHYVSVNRLLG